MTASSSIRNTPYSGTDRRHSPDRRRFTIRSMWRSLIQPRRFQGRRSADRRFALLDRYDSGVVTLAIALLLLSIADSVFTLTLIANGGREVNPFMDALLGHSIWAFTIVKMVLTAIPALILVAAGNLMVMGMLRARSLLAVMVGLYGGLIVYELLLLSQLPG